MPVQRVLLAQPRGFCAGVEMAIKALSSMLELFEPPVYCYHEIVHNRLVVDRFREQGVIFVDDIDEVPEGAPLMLSAHGSAPEVVAAARTKDRFVVNAVCPLVTKVHHEAKVRANKGFTVLYVGHQGHDEATGTLAVAPEAMRLVESEADLDAVLPTVADPSQVALLAQTTLSVNDWEGIMARAREHFPDLWTATRDDLCFATTNRQAALPRHRRARRHHRRHRERELVQYHRTHQGRARRGLRARVAGRRPRRDRRRHARERACRRCHCRRERTRGPRPGRDRASRSSRGRRERARHRRGRILPSAP